MTEKKTITHMLNMELSDRETFLIGAIIAQWGWLEHEIFLQTVATFDAPEGVALQLPGAMRNIRFSAVLDLWKERVLEQASEDHTAILLEQLDEIRRLKPARDALVHGMWQWAPGNLSQICTVRVRNREVIEFHFTADDLEDFHRRVAAVNFTIRYPGGVDDHARELAERGMYISRRFWPQSRDIRSPTTGNLLCSRAMTVSKREVTPNKALQTDKDKLSCLLRTQKPRQLAFAAELGR